MANEESWAAACAHREEERERKEGRAKGEGPCGARCGVAASTTS